MTETYHCNFLRPDGTSLMFSLEIDVLFRKEEIRNKLLDVIGNDYIEVLLKRNTYEQLFYIFDTDSKAELKMKIIRGVSPKYRCISIHKNQVLGNQVLENSLIKKRKCQGCKEGIMNQYGHMDEGGCLNMENSEDVENIEDVKSCLIV